MDLDPPRLAGKCYLPSPAIVFPSQPMPAKWSVLSLAFACRLTCDLRECWERRGSGSTSSRPRHRTPRHENKGVIGNAATTCGGGVGGGGARGPPSPSPRSPTPPESRRTSAAGHARGGTGSASGAGTLAVAKTIEGGDAGGASVSGFRSRDANSEGKGGGGGGRGRRGGAGVSGGVGYFELEQRISRTGGHDDGDSCGRSGARDRAGDDADAAGAEEAQEGERSSRSRKESGPGITLKVYGDVWRWLGDEKVCSLREKVVEARFSLVHVASVARKAHKIAQVGSEELLLRCPQTSRYGSKRRRVVNSTNTLTAYGFAALDQL